MSAPDSIEMVSSVDQRVVDHPSQDTSATDLSVASVGAPPANQVSDGGYGWVIVFACSAITLFTVDITYSWGVIQSRLVQDGVGTAFVGSTLLGGGAILSGWATDNVAALFATAGLVMGIGTSLCFMVCSTLPAQYFSRKRGVANGIVYAGGGLGGAIISIVLSISLEHLGTRWTFRVLGLITLSVLYPTVWLIKGRNHAPSKYFVEWRLFKDIRFVILFVAGAVGTFPLFVAPFFLPMYSSLAGLSASAGAGLLAGYNLCSAIGRLGFGYLGDVMGPVNSLFFSLTLGAISMLVIWPFATTPTPLAIFVILNGAANGGFFALMPTIVATVFGSVRVAVAMSMIVTAWAGGYLLGSPIAGYLLSAYGGQKAGLKAYHLAIFYSGSLSVGAAGLIAALRFMISPKALSRG